MRTYPFKQVDVFTSKPYFGNPVAVVFNADELNTSEMQRIAAWTNLSETTFVLKPSTSAASYRLRIFTPKKELPFAGHPTIGTAHAILEAGLISPDAGILKQECGAGILQLRVKENHSNRQIFVRAPEARISPFNSSLNNRLAEVLRARVEASTPPLLIDVGPVWLVTNLGSAKNVIECRPDMGLITEMSHELNLTGITVFGMTGEDEAAVEVRSFAPAHNVPEDPVCGSGNISVGAFLFHYGLVKTIGATYRAKQGSALGRNGFVEVSIDQSGKGIEIGGNSVTCINGTIII